MSYDDVNDFDPMLASMSGKPIREYDSLGYSVQGSGISVPGSAIRNLFPRADCPNGITSPSVKAQSVYRVPGFEPANPGTAGSNSGVDYRRKSSKRVVAGAGCHLKLLVQAVA